MKVAIIGAGATGLAAARDLLRAGHEVLVADAATELGGLAGSLDVDGQAVERYYHHVFKSDRHFLGLADELGMSDDLVWATPSTGIFYAEKRYAFGTAAEMLRFPPLTLGQRLRFAASSALLKAARRGEPFARYTALEWLRRFAGAEVTTVVWEPLLRGKFGTRADEVSMAWLWARVHSRTFALGYVRGGFARFYEALAADITANGGEIRLGWPVRSIEGTPEGARIGAGEDVEVVDAVLATVQQPVFERLLGRAHDRSRWEARFFGATCFLLVLDRSFMTDYWLNVNDRDFPFLAVVEHTRLTGTEGYGGKHLLYVGNYLDRDDSRYVSDPEELLEAYVPYLQRINPRFRPDWISAWHFSKAPHAQPVMTTDYADLIPAVRTEVPRVYLSTMAQVYPYDRGQNYAIKLGREAAALIVGDFAAAGAGVTPGPG